MTTQQIDSDVRAAYIRTDKTLFAAIRAMGLSVQKRDSEYRITYPVDGFFPGPRDYRIARAESCAAYCADRGEAFDTAREFIAIIENNKGAERSNFAAYENAANMKAQEACRKVYTPTPEEKAARIASDSTRHGRTDEAQIQTRPDGSRYVDLTPTWSQILDTLLLCYTDSSAEGRKLAREELGRMASLADLHVASASK